MTRKQAIEHGKEQLQIFGGEHKEFIKTAVKCLEECEESINIAYLKGFQDGIAEAEHRAEGDAESDKGRS